MFGILTSQIGYESSLPKRVVIRADQRGRLNDQTPFVIHPDGDDRIVHRGDLNYWGQLWSSHWWVGDFNECGTPGSYQLQFNERDGIPRCSMPFDIGRNILWNRSFEPVALDQLERRALLAKTKLGWMDAGGAWQEVNSHQPMVTGLIDALIFAGDRMTESQRQRLLRQVVTGCDYMSLVQDEAARRGHPAGSVSHMIPGYEDQIIAADASKCALAWAMAAGALKADDPAKAQDYEERAMNALAFSIAHPPATDHGFHRGQRGLSESYYPPAGEHPTRDLLMMAWAAVELAKLGHIQFQSAAAELLEQVMRRQARPDENMHGLGGFFFEFSDRHHAEPAWAHQIKIQPVGMDAGATLANGLIPMIQALRLWPGDPRAAAWRSCLQRFAYEYFLPGCRRNPFLLLPLQLHREHGLLGFVGPWHGMNTIYGQAAALGYELADLFGDPAFIEVATGNIQWIAGLNAGVTRDSLIGCVITSHDIPEDAAIPFGFIHGVGRRWAGSWMNIRGSVCNGFSVGKQFEFDTPVTRDNDGPHSFTDEEWIPHAGGWLSAISRMCARRI